MGKSKKLNYTTIATKIPLNVKQKLYTIAEILNLSIYELLQYLILFYVRYFDNDSPISDEYEIMLDAFINVVDQSMKNSSKPFNVKQKYISSAIIFIQQNNNIQYQTIAIGKDGQGRITENYNLDKMLSEYLKATDPETLERLVCIQKQIGFFSISHTLHYLVKQSNCSQKEDIIKMEIESMFKDNDRVYNKSLNYGERTIRKKHFTPDTIKDY